MNANNNLELLSFFFSQIPQPGWDKLFVTFVPAESGKVTAKTNKANVRNGNCKWSDPIYETTRLIQDAKTKKYDEKLYKLVVAMVFIFHWTRTTFLFQIQQQLIHLPSWIFEILDLKSLMLMHS